MRADLVAGVNHPSGQTSCLGKHAWVRRAPSSASSVPAAQPYWLRRDTRWRPCAGRAPHQVDADGRVIQALHDATGATARTITSATEHAGRLYLGSLAPDLRAIPVLDLSRVQRAPSR